MFDDDARTCRADRQRTRRQQQNRPAGASGGGRGLAPAYEELRLTSAPLAARFDLLLGDAPLARLRAALPPDAAARVRRGASPSGTWRRPSSSGRSRRARPFGRRQALVLFDGRDDWRTAIAEYTRSLHGTRRSLRFNPDAAMQATELSAVGARVGADLTPENRDAARPQVHDRVYAFL